MAQNQSQSHRVGNTTATFLIFFPLIIMITVGALNNNLVNSGVSGNPSLTCDQTIGFCYNSGSTGCQSNPSSCAISNTVSFLSQTSPFTQILKGNILGVFNLLTTGNASVGHGPFDAIGSGPYFTANCVVSNAVNASMGLQRWTIDYCTQARPDGSNMTKAQASVWSNWNNGHYGHSASIPFYHLDFSNVTGYAMICEWNLQTNYTFSGTPYAGWTWYGCDVHTLSGAGGCVSFAPPTLACIKNNYMNGFMISVPFAYGTLVNTKGYHCSYAMTGVCWRVNVPVQFENWETAFCFDTQPQLGGVRANLPYLISTQCDQWVSNSISQSQSSATSFGILGPIVTFILGLAFFFLGTGIGFNAGTSVLGTGGQFGIFSNPQGSKMAQVIGGGLVIWSVIYSEFGGWLSPTYLPAGLDVVAFFMISGSFFFGLYERF